MRRFFLTALLVIAAGAMMGTACSDEHSQQCRDICKRTDDCADSAKDPNFKFDEGECRAACAFLERDEDKGKAIVADHAACVKKASSCADVLACD